MVTDRFFFFFKEILKDKKNGVAGGGGRVSRVNDVSLCILFFSWSIIALEC